MLDLKFIHAIIFMKITDMIVQGSFIIVVSDPMSVPVNVKSIIKIIHKLAQV